MTTYETSRPDVACRALGILTDVLCGRFQLAGVTMNSPAPFVIAVRIMAAFPTMDTMATAVLHLLATMANKTACPSFEAADMAALTDAIVNGARASRDPDVPQEFLTIMHELVSLSNGAVFPVASALPFMLSHIARVDMGGVIMTVRCLAGAAWRTEMATAAGTVCALADKCLRRCEENVHVMDRSVSLLFSLLAQLMHPHGFSGGALWAVVPSIVHVMTAFKSNGRVGQHGVQLLRAMAAYPTGVAAMKKAGVGAMVRSVLAVQTMPADTNAQALQLLEMLAV